MEAEEVLKLFESKWFEQRIFSRKEPSSTPMNNQFPEVHEQHKEAKLLPATTLHARSLSDRFLGSGTSFSSDSPSSNSEIILKPKLQEIVSGKEVEASYRTEAEEEVAERSSTKTRNYMAKRGPSKSLSELELDELKGFIDLGFVFSEEDRNSKLVSIIPGLQRLGREEGEEIKDHEISRPYLSEAWGSLDRMRVSSPWIHSRIQSFHDEVDMKNHLKIWAHGVASTVRSGR
ncbi:uncharacterized protein LOC127791610 [Diospyros lotus]|uniref:uncharacterized protein LOC127791610 n=1 Tax=Diospyros lotus TaxID=55363 RepID=UPI002254849B|nr:uncharacterized protein LOC127791610 [Diospyros lotus]